MESPEQIISGSHPCPMQRAVETGARCRIGRKCQSWDQLTTMLTYQNPNYSNKLEAHSAWKVESARAVPLSFAVCAHVIVITRNLHLSFPLCELHFDGGTLSCCICERSQFSTYSQLPSWNRKKKVTIESNRQGFFDVADNNVSYLN